MSILNYNVVQFQPSGGGDPVTVVFESDFVWSAGLKHNVNIAKSPYTEVAKFNNNFQVTGTLNFFQTSDPTDEDASPDLSIENMILIEAIPSRDGIGIPMQAGGGASIQTVEWELHFADWRYNFASPRGGRLRWGCINPSNVQPADPGDLSGDQTPNGTFSNPLQNDQLIQRCLDAMNFDGCTIDANVDNVDPPLNLQWHGNHAPTELEKLLQHCGAAFCPHFDGTASIEVMGSGSDPTVPAGQLIGNFPLGQLDHRGTTVVFSSAPTPVLNTLNIVGPSSTTWEYVIQDIDKTWKTLTETPPPEILCGFDPVQLIQQNFAQLTNSLGSPGIASDGNSYIHSLRSQLYHCIRLNVADYPPNLQPILHQRLENSAGTQASGSNPALAAIAARPLVTAKVAMLPPDGSMPYNSTSPVDCNAHLHMNDAVLVCHIRLGKMSSAPSSTSDYNNLFTPLADGDLTGRITQESLDGNSQPLYYESAFQYSQNEVTQLGENQVLNLMDSPDAGTIFVSRPDFQLLNVDGTDVNRSNLDSASTALAPFYLSDPTLNAHEIHAVGFQAADNISGTVSEIRISQRQLKTVYSCDNWWRATGPHLRGWREHIARGNGAHGLDAYPQQQTQQTMRTQLGLSGSTQPSMSLDTKDDENEAPGGVGICGCSQSGGVSGTDGAASCTFTYNFWNINDPNETLLNTGGPQAPKNARIANLQYTAGTVGFYFYNLQGTALLMCVFDEKITNTFNCES